MRYYLDEGRTYIPQFGPPTPVLAFSVSSEATSTSSERVAAVTDSGSTYVGLGYPFPEPTFDREPVATICSQCAVRLDADAQVSEEYEELGRHTRNFSPLLTLLPSYSSMEITFSDTKYLASQQYPRPEEAT